MDPLLAPLIDALASWPEVVARQRQAGRPVVAYVGGDVPLELIRAAGMTPVRLGDEREDGAAAATVRADALLGTGTLEQPLRALLHRLLDPDDDVADHLLLSHDTDATARLFAIARELWRTDRLHPLRGLAFLDRTALPGPQTTAYDAGRRLQVRARLEAWAGEPIDPRAEERERAAAAELTLVQGRLWAWRAQRPGRLSGSGALLVRRVAEALGPDALPLLQALEDRAEQLGPATGRRVVLTGTPVTEVRRMEEIESGGLLVVAESARPSARRSPREIADEALRSARVRHAVAVVHRIARGDDAAEWDLWALRPALERAGVELIVLDERDVPEAPAAARAVERPRSARGPGERSRKSLRAVADFGAHQREWFQSVRARAAAGEPFAVVNADAPQELLRAFDIPFVVNQWWGSIVAAKQQTPHYLARLREHGYPDGSEQYSSQGIAALWDDTPHAPWGGLPRPTILQAIASGDATRKLFEGWATESGARLTLLERSIESRLELPIAWWDELPDGWSEVLEPERLDLMHAQLLETVHGLEQLTGRDFPEERFRRVMDLVNEQEELYRRTRDLIAATSPAPVSVVDTMPATMLPQWQRGTPWARDAAQALYDEVAERVDRGAAAWPDERLRLMWVGRGLWGDMGLYQRFEDRHGAVFVWSMYLALAADGYLRSFDRGRDPLRALAARFVTMGDELRMPTWAGAWHVKEARSHRVDAAVAAADADPFVVRALQDAGIPVLTLAMDNVDMRGWDGVEDRIHAFLDVLDHQVA
jgi:benzoyl-CoA reductase/2-hydroxyglutaryl-CoA dehydratase subunit BcrC/BadD/HgdB